MNVVFRGGSMRSHLTTGESADQAVVFLNEPLVGGAYEPPTPEAACGGFWSGRSNWTGCNSCIPR
jgi:hypothetical protein